MNHVTNSDSNQPQLLNNVVPDKNDEFQCHTQPLFKSSDITTCKVRLPVPPSTSSLPPSTLNVLHFVINKSFINHSYHFVKFPFKKRSKQR